MKDEEQDKQDKRGKAPKVSEEARVKGYVTAEEIAGMLKLSTQRIRQLRNDGAMVTEDTPQGKRYHLAKSLLALCKHLLEKQDRDALKERKEKAEAEYKEGKAALMEIEYRKRKGEVHEARHVRELINGMIIETKSAFLAIPGRIAVQLTLCTNENEMAEVVRRAICDVMDEMSTRQYDPDKFRQMVDEDGDMNAADDDEDDETQDA